MVFMRFELGKKFLSKLRLSIYILNDKKKCLSLKIYAFIKQLIQKTVLKTVSLTFPKVL